MPGMMICTPMSRTFFFTDVRVTIGFADTTATDDDEEDGAVAATVEPEPDLFVDNGLLLTIPLFDGTVATVVALVV